MKQHGSPEFTLLFKKSKKVPLKGQINMLNFSGKTIMYFNMFKCKFRPEFTCSWNTCIARWTLNISQSIKCKFDLKKMHIKILLIFFHFFIQG